MNPPIGSQTAALVWFAQDEPGAQGLGTAAEAPGLWAVEEKVG